MCVLIFGNIKVATLKNLFEERKIQIVYCLIAIHWGLSLFDRGQALAVTPDGLRCQSREPKEWHGCRANKGVSGSGKYFFEAIVTDEGLCRVGWSTSQASTFIGNARVKH